MRSSAGVIGYDVGDAPKDIDDDADGVTDGDPVAERLVDDDDEAVGTGDAVDVEDRVHVAPE